jgi:hypothetical protein
VPSSHDDQVRQWQAERDASLRRPTGWLSLVGLYPLVPGSLSFGSDSAGDLVLPAPAPAHVGRLQVAADSVVVEIAAGVDVAVVGDSTSVDRMRLRTDADSLGATRLQLGSLTWWVIERGGQRMLRVTDADSDVLTGFSGLGYYPIDATWRLPARWVKPERPRTVDVPTVLGQPSASTSAGWLEFAAGGSRHRLEALGRPGDSELFVIFGDATNGTQTYGAGRFLYVDVSAVGHLGDSLSIDFNRAYTPPCAFTPYATCPLPPPGNVLSIEIPAGEKWHDDHRGVP